MGLSRNLIFKPIAQKLTSEEEFQEKQNMELFCDMLEKNGVASLTNPSKEISRKQYYDEVRTGKVEITEYHDSTGQTDLSDYLDHIMNGDDDEV